MSNDTRDLVVIGASLGGVEALSALVAGLPADLPAAVLVVQHTSPSSGGQLAQILDRRGGLPARMAADGDPLKPGGILVAPPDRHMLVAPDAVRVRFGPRENRARPAIDPLFRTAAVHHRSRVIGVILSGLQSDGAAGLSAVHRCGGIAVVQDPDEAAHPQMPLNAIAAAAEAQVVSLEEMSALLGRLCREGAPEPPPVPEILRIEAHLNERAMSDDWRELPSRSTDFSCPDCDGPIRELEDPDVQRFRCLVGHAYTMEALAEAKDDSVEQALWIALRALQERSGMLEEMVRGHTGESLIARAREARSHVEILRNLLTRLAAPAPGSNGPE